MRSCPACRRIWPGDLLVCPDCLAHLVDDLDATITCGQCGHVCPSRMQSCPSCFALLRAEDADLSRSYAHALATGNPMHRPPGRDAFAEGPGCTVQRLAAGAPLVLVGVDGFVEATVEGSAPLAAPPLSCTSDDRLLFRLEHYGAADGALVAIGADDAAVATYLRTGSLLTPGLDVRDETSAPVASLALAGSGADFLLIEMVSDTVLAEVRRVEVEHERWLDDEWTVTPTAVGESGRPLATLALPALAVAAKVLLGRPRAVAIERPEIDGLDP